MFRYESEILNSINFETSRILIIDFLYYYIKDINIPFNSKIYNYCFYMLNLSYLSPKLKSLSKSLLAFSIIYYVTKIFKFEIEWPKKIYSINSVNDKVFVYMKCVERYKMLNSFENEIETKFKMNKTERIGDNLFKEEQEKEKENENENKNLLQNSIASKRISVLINKNQTNNKNCLKNFVNIHFDLLKVKSVSADLFGGNNYYKTILLYIFK